ncbi:MAG TPA: ferrous iron transport protein A [Clostridiales bacterium]|nr:ferrous iron transport protein A [Clostridiales bacterium]
MSLCDLKPGQCGYIQSISGNKKLVKRLLALGCIEGTPVKVKLYAPLGDPIIINIRGFDLAIRKKDAMNIQLREA